jgi:hypothetical protein
MQWNVGPSLADAPVDRLTAKRLPTTEALSLPKGGGPTLYRMVTAERTKSAVLLLCKIIANPDEIDGRKKAQKILGDDANMHAPIGARAIPAAATGLFVPFRGKDPGLGLVAASPR